MAEARPSDKRQAPFAASLPNALGNPLSASRRSRSRLWCQRSWWDLAVPDPATGPPHPDDPLAADDSVARWTQPEKRRNPCGCRGSFRAQEENRTPDLLITSELLCRLSYLGVFRWEPKTSDLTGPSATTGNRIGWRATQRSDGNATNSAWSCRVSFGLNTSASARDCTASAAVRNTSGSAPSASASR